MFIIYDAGILVILFCVVALVGFGSVFSFFEWIAENNVTFIIWFIIITMIKALIIAFRARNKYYSIYSFIGSIIPYLPIAAFFIYVANIWFANDYGLFTMFFVLSGRIFVLCILAMISSLPDMMITTEEREYSPLKTHVRKKMD